MQLSNILATVNNLLDEDGVRRPPATITATINEGYRVVAITTQGCEHSVSYRNNAGSFVSPLPLDFYTAVSVYYDGVRVYPIRLADLDDLNSAWMSAAAATPIYYTTIGALTDSPQLWLYPAPTTTGTIKMTYAAVPGPLGYDSDVPEFPREHHYTLVWWTYAWELLKERSAILVNKSFQTYGTFIEELTALQQYVYRRTPDRDWMSPPLDADAMRRKIIDVEQALARQPGTIEQQALVQ